MLTYYPTLIEAAIEFKVQSRMILADYKKEEYVHDPSHLHVDHSSQYRLAHDT